jgi:hypothetical protein
MMRKMFIKSIEIRDINGHNYFICPFGEVIQVISTILFVLAIPISSELCFRKTICGELFIGALIAPIGLWFLGAIIGKDRR